MISRASRAQRSPAEGRVACARAASGVAACDRLETFGRWRKLVFVSNRVGVSK